MTTTGKHNHVAGLRLIGNKLDLGSFNYALADFVVIGPGVRNATVESSNVMLLKDWDGPRERVYHIDNSTLSASNADEFYCAELPDAEFHIYHREEAIYWMEHIKGSELLVSIINKETFEERKQFKINK